MRQGNCLKQNNNDKKKHERLPEHHRGEISQIQFNIKNVLSVQYSPDNKFMMLPY